MLLARNDASADDHTGTEPTATTDSRVRVLALDPTQHHDENQSKGNVAVDSKLVRIGEVDGVERPRKLEDSHDDGSDGPEGQEPARVERFCRQDRTPETAGGSMSPTHGMRLPRCKGVTLAARIPPPRDPPS